ncbi:hypothetical protein J3A83DRAFT_4234766 [Scleroderma citrinum]
MSLSMLVNGGAECGPTNPLRGLAKQFDHDRGPQQDLSVRTRQPQEAFRTTQLPTSELQQDAARFFSPSISTADPKGLGAHQQHFQSHVFDLTHLHDTLPQPGPSVPAQLPHAAFAGAGWASDFILNHSQPQHAQAKGEMLGASSVDKDTQERVQNPTSVGGARAWGSPYMGYGMGMRMTMTTPMQGQAHPQVQKPEIQSDHMLWDKEFQSQEHLLRGSVSSVKEENTVHRQDQQPSTSTQAPATDEMARLAAQVIEAVEHEQNPKFKESAFMGLMRQLRDGEVVVDRNGFVASDSASTTIPVNSIPRSESTDVKGKGKARAMDTGGLTSLSSSSTQVLELDANEAYFRQENDDFKAWWDAHHAGPSLATTSGLSTTTAGPSTMSLVQQKQKEIGQWFEMQNAWDEFEATTTGIRPVVEYEFQKENPYLRGEEEMRGTRNHMMHVEGVEKIYESILELEAAIQQDPYNAGTWYELGVRQQSSEREAKAIQALRRCLAIDPSYLPAWLALGVSYTNESNRTGTYDAVREWVMRHPDARYREIMKEKGSEALANGAPKKFQQLVEILIEMARASGEAQQVDADVQIVLAVLLNAMEDYPRALDCFLTALAVRPEDWLLYNRTGATMANNGRGEEALAYYYRALELNPGYIRARYNLGISCINLRRYEEAATHILDALVLQDNEGSNSVDEMVEGTGNRPGVTSSTLWDSLKSACLHLSRADLAAMCDRFRSVFNAGI